MRDRSTTAICRIVQVGRTTHIVHGAATIHHTTSHRIITPHRGRSALAGIVQVGVLAFTRVITSTIGHITHTATLGVWDTIHGTMTGTIVQVGTTDPTRTSCTLIWTAIIAVEDAALA